MNLRKTTDRSHVLQRLLWVTSRLLFPIPLWTRKSGSPIPVRALFIGPVGHP